MASLQEAIGQLTTHVRGMSQQTPATASEGFQPNDSADVAAGLGEDRDPVDQVQTLLRLIGCTRGLIG